MSEGEHEKRKQKSCVVVSFLPRQVMLRNQNESNKIQTVISQNGSKVNNLEPCHKNMKKRHRKRLLLHSICAYFEKKGYSETLSALRSEVSNLEVGNGEVSSLNLEDIFSKYLKESQYNKGADISGSKENNQDDKKEDRMEASLEPNERKKKKIIVDDVNKETESEWGGSKPKEKKKKSNLDCVSSPQVANPLMSVTPQVVMENVESHAKSKDKKRKKNKLKAETLNETSCLKISKEVIGEQIPSSEKKSQKHESTSDVDDSNELRRQNSEKGAIGERKKSKKKKAPSSEENHPLNNGIAKNKVIDGYKESFVEKPCEEKQLEEQISSHLKNPSFTPKSSKKGSDSQIKTLNPFQRVKADEVVFADERLQDNSYWAKSGADNGYGAKAQEILGQVKGRDFRHEKTKKKRGSYKGGQIDLQSHSIKFNYSDEDE